ncbi:hypothetical protein [Anaeromyxobacter oryzisoli]|uniref:hypothetical protein n=1 Tax=Anaeromyxobacter oryzisoli TaxID=2925408 RepID=UPI001F5A7D6A|nr:hypothetical protein [Anaeromyxobacter sp. SG63]
MAVAKAIASAAGSFLEGTLTELISQVYAQDARRFPGKSAEWTQRCASDRPPGLGAKLTCFKKIVKKFNSGANITEPSDLKGARNAVDHGNLIQPGALHLDDPEFFRRQAYDYLAKAYQAIGISPPGWMVAP